MTKLTQSFIEAARKNFSIDIIGPMKTIFPLETLKGPIIYVDGGLCHKMKINHSIENISIGDGDSSNQSLNIKLKTDKDFSDLSYVLNICSQSSIECLNLIGFLGGRKDHELMNLGESHHYLCKNPNSMIKFDNEIIAFSKNYLELEIFGGFSLISFCDNQVKIEGDCEYQLSDWTPVTFLNSFTLSNMASGKVRIQAKQPLFIFFFRE